MKNKIPFYALCLSVSLLVLPQGAHAQTDAELEAQFYAEQEFIRQEAAKNLDIEKDIYSIDTDAINDLLEQADSLLAEIPDKPFDASSALSGGASNVVSGGSNEYFDSYTKDRNLRDNSVPRRVDPRFEPGSKYIVIEKGASATSHQAMLVAANRALNLGRISSALELYEKLYKKNKKDRTVLMGLAVAQQKSGFHESAIATYEELLSLSPNNVEAQVNMLGLVKKQYPSVAYRRLVDLWEKNPRNAGLAAQVGMVSAELGNNDDAMHYMGVAASLDPKNANHMYNMAIIVDRAGGGTKAIEYYERALELDATYGGSRTIPRDSVYDRLSLLRRM